MRAVVRAKCPPQDIIAACERQDLNASIYDPTKELERTSHGTQFTSCFTGTKVQILTLTGLAGEEAVSPAKDAAMLGYETPLSEVCLPLLATHTTLSTCNQHRAELLRPYTAVIHTHTHTHTHAHNTAFDAGRGFGGGGGEPTLPHAPRPQRIPRSRPRQHGRQDYWRCQGLRIFLKKSFF